MAQTASETRTSESIYSVIGDAGSLRAEEISVLLGVDGERAQSWLTKQVGAGYLYVDEFGTFGTSCPWPRAGF